MPQIRFPANYPLPPAQAALLADPDALPGFNPTDDPDSADPGLNTVSAGDPTPIPPSPTNAADAESANTVALPPLSSNGTAPKMAPSRNGTPPPPVDLPRPPPVAAAPQAPNPGAPPPDMAAGLQDAIQAPATNAAGGPTPPEAPNSNWAERLGKAVLSLTRFAPMANQIIHPKWAEQMQAYQGQKAAFEAEQAQEQQATATQAEAEKAEAYAAQKNAQAASYAQTQDQRKTAAQDRLKAAFEKTMGPNAVQLGPGESVPQGFTPFTDPTDPNSVWVRRSPIVTAPKELLPYLPGIKEGQPITQPELDGAFKAAQAVNLENVRAGNKPEKTPNEVQLAIDAGNPDPNVSGPARATLARLATQHLAEHPTIINQIPGLGPQAAGNTLTGDDFLNSLPPGTAAQVKAIAEGRAALPPLGMRGIGAQLRDAVFKYDPSYSDQRAQVRKAFTSGPDGRNIGNLNTAPVHLDALADLAKAMDNGSFQPGNELYNRVSTMLGAPAPTNYEGLRQAVAGEMDAALHGTSTIPGRDAIAATMPAKAAPGQMAGIIDTNLATLAQKLNTYHERYQQQIPNDTVWSPVLPSARAVFQKHGIDASKPAASETNNNGSGTITVTAPNGKTYHFKDQKSADTFKKNAGIQ
jgi:hypothetical protein